MVIELSAWFRLVRRKYEVPVIMVKQTGHGPEMVAKVETVQQKKKKRDLIHDFTRNEAKKWYHNYHEMLEKVHDLKPLAKKFFKRIRCSRLEWHTVMGTGQASETGALTGIVWGIKSMIVGMASHTISLRTMPSMSVQPVWNQAVLRTQIRCVFHFFLGHALITGVKVLLRVRKKRELKWQTTPTQA